MTIKASGSLSFSEIATEFGSPSNKNLGAYRVSQTIDSDLANLPLDAGIPQSGSIKFSDFYGKKLNIVVDCGYNSNLNSVKSYQRYINEHYTVIGGFKKGPSDTSGSKIICYVNKILSSSKGNILNSALHIESSWNTGTELIVNVGPKAGIYGAGGDGGNSPSVAGTNGTTAIKVQFPCTILNRGYIQSGYGGGGGGAGWTQTRTVTVTSGGGKKSDIRLKTNIETLDNVLDKLMKI